jgi:hypothetical protein
VLIFSAVGFGAQTDGDNVLPGLGRNSAAQSYTRDALGSIAPISPTYIERRLGTAAVERLTRSSETPGSDTTKTPTPRPTPPVNSGEAPPPAIQGKPGTVPGLAPGGWILTLAMAPNAATVPPGGEIVYRMSIKNVGTEDFRGRSFLLEWHTPVGTVGRNALTECNLIPVTAARELCQSQRLSISPGAGDARHEQTSSAGLIAIRPGETWVQEWHVQTLPSATPGTQYTTHAHLTVSIDGKDVVVSTPPVVVTVS